jgi:hypothetical protein
MTPLVGLSPDREGFMDAQRRLREKLGRDVCFYTPLPEAFAFASASGKFDPETKLPYDPQDLAIASGASGFASAVVRCSVVFQPLTTIRRSETERTALGIRSRHNKDLIADIADLDAVKDADFFIVGKLVDGVFVGDDIRWMVVNVQTDGVGEGHGPAGEQRVVIFGEDSR